MCGPRGAPQHQNERDVKMIAGMKSSFNTVQMPKMTAAMIAP
jgi:hypothetical protein